MASVGTASLTIVPKFDNLGKSVNDALGGIDMSGAGSAAGRSFGSAFDSAGSSILGAGALAGAISSLADKALDMVSSSFDAAASRLDTLNSYSTVVSNLGASSEEADDSLNKMVDHLDGLPTSLDQMASSVQGIAAVTGDLDQATDASLAFNDMMLAAGSSTEQAGSASEQFRQILAKGKPDLQDWQSLTAAAPAQMNQLAEEMLGAGATADDLYTALGGGGAEATKSTDDLLGAMVKLDQDGGNGVKSFADQAHDATGGVQSSMENMETAVTRGLTDVLDSVGTERIQAVCGAIGDAFEDVLGVIANVVDKIMPFIDKIMGAFGNMGTGIEAALGNFGIFEVATSSMEKFAKKAAETEKSLNPLQNQAKGLSDMFWNLADSASEGSKAEEAFMKMGDKMSGTMGTVITGAVDGAIFALSMLAGYLYDCYEKAKLHKEATEGLSGAVEKSVDPALGLSGAYDAMGDSADDATPKLSDLKQTLEDNDQKLVDLSQTIQGRTTDLEADVAELEYYWGVIDEYAGRSDLDAQQQAKLRDAIAQVNENCDTQYSVMDGTNQIIDDNTQEVVDNTDAIRDNIRAQEDQMRQEVYREDWQDAVQALVEIQEEYEGALSYRNECQQMVDDMEEQINNLPDCAPQRGEMEEALNSYRIKLGQAEKALGDYDEQIGTAQATVDTYAEKVTDAGEGVDRLKFELEQIDGVYNMTDSFNAMGMDAEALSWKLHDAGISADDLSSIAANDFADMADECGGDVDRLIGMIQEYNDQPVEEKDTDIQVDDNSLVDSMGRVYEWDGSQLIPLESDVSVDDAELVDATGDVWTWNSTDLSWKNTTANVDYQQLHDANGEIYWYDGTDVYDKNGEVTMDAGDLFDTNDAIVDYRNTPDDLGTKRGFVEIITDFIGDIADLFTGHAAGGIRLDAAGGIVDAYSAYGGGIATRAVPLDIVGEDGAEAIVPLTNRRYAMPFAQLIADEVADASGTVNNYTTYIGDIKLEGDAAQQAKDYVDRLVTMGGY